MYSIYILSVSVTDVCVLCLCVSEHLHMLLCPHVYTSVCWLLFIIFSWGMQYKAAHSPCAPCCPPVQSTVMAASCSTPCWLYIIPAFLSLGFLFVFPDALPRLSHWDYKETILRAEQHWTHDLGSFKVGGGGWVSLNQYSASSIWSKGAEWSGDCCTDACDVLRLSRCMHSTYWQCRVHITLV